MSAKWKGRQLMRDKPSGHLSPESGWVKKIATTIDVTEGLRTFFSDSGDSTPRSDSPAHAPRAIFRREKKLTRRRSGHVVPLQRPRLRRKAATAPPGTPGSLTFRPRPNMPRRAISARVETLHKSRSARISRDIMISPLLPRVSELGTPESRSLITRRRRGIKQPKPKRPVWRMVSPQLVGKYQTISDELWEKGTTSFSEKLRVKETLKKKNVKRIDMNIVNFEERRLPDTPGSMGNTPRELYGFRTPQPTSANRAKRPPLPVRPINQRHSAAHWDKQDAWRRQVYLPGRIRLADSPANATRKASVATLEPFVGAVQGNYTGRRLSRDGVMDDIVAYFEDFGIVAETLDEGLDRFYDWEKERQIRQRHMQEAYLHPNPPSVPPPRPPLGRENTSPKALRMLGLEEASRLGVLPSPPPADSGPIHPFADGTFERQAAEPSPVPRSVMKLKRFLRLPR